MPLESLLTKAKPLYSSLEEALANLTRNKGTGAEFLKELEKKPGVKKAEIQDRGLDKVLADLPKVDKVEVQKAVRKNPPARVEVTTKMENPYLHPDFHEIRNEVVEQHTPYDDYGRPMRRFSESDADEMAVEALGGPAKYYEYQLPNGKNYREMLLQLPEDSNPYNNYYGPHWDEPNVLAHMRLSDRTGPNGEKVLHLEELQSDWHQQGRDKGYGLKNQEVHKAFYITPEGEKVYIGERNSKEDLDNWLDYSGWNKYPVDIQYSTDKIKTGEGVPDAPFKKNWEELALKHLINHAVDNGYDKIAITPGAVQADRYDLSKQIANVEYNELGDLRAYDHNGRRVLSQNVLPEKVSDYVGKELGSKIAENHANRIQARSDYRTAIKNDAPDDQVDALYQKYLSHPTEYSGLDLNVGGEGMKAAYDQRIPNILNKLGKPFGAQTEMNAMPVETGKQIMVPDNAGLGMISSGQPETANLHSFDITPELKQQVQTEGLPAYKKGGAVKITKNPDAMWMDVQERKFADGGEVKQTPSEWLKSLGNTPSPEFHPIDTLTQNLQGLAQLPSRAYEGAKQLVTDPQAYFSNIKAPTPEEMAMAFNPAGVGAGLMGMTKAVKPSLLSNEMKVLPNDVSTRVPTAVKATEDPLKSTLLSDYPTMKKDPEALEHNLGLIKTYPNFVSKSRSVNGQMEDFINNTKDNLLFLHDMVPADTRERSKLWYDGAHNIVDRFGDQYGTPEHASAGVLAVLSPQKDWFMNVSLGDRVHDIWKNQGDYKWDKDMTGTANEIFNKPQYAPMLKAIKGKAFNELTDPTEKAMWLRTFDQTYNPREHQIVTPEGDFSGTRLTDKGQPYKTGWGSLNEIGKAIDILDNPTKENISANLGGQHKVRNFYNNIYFPNNPDPHVTIDTHAVAAGLLRPLSGNSREVSHNFGSNSLGEVGPKNSAFTGLQGTYPAYAEAYKRAAEERGLLPRQMQSITWEAVRGLFPDTFKNATNNAEINNIWDQYKRKKITIDDARQKILEKAGGINEPEWKQ
jgi:hypothetical protein